MAAIIVNIFFIALGLGLLFAGWSSDDEHGLGALAGSVFGLPIAGVGGWLLLINLGVV